MTDPVSTPAYRVLGFQAGVGPEEVSLMLELISATGDVTQRRTFALRPRTAGELAKQLAEAATIAVAAKTPAGLQQ